EIWSHDFALGSKGAIIGEESVGVMEPSGKFTLLSLADGRQLIDEQLEAEPQLKAIFILPSRDQIHLVTSQSQLSPAQAGRTQVTPVGQNAPNSPAKEIGTGRVSAFDRRSGQKQWPSPAEIVQQGLLTQQPNELPVLTFLRLVYSIDGSNA